MDDEYGNNRLVDNLINNQLNNVHQQKTLNFADRQKLN